MNARNYKRNSKKIIIKKNFLEKKEIVFLSKFFLLFFIPFAAIHVLPLDFISSAIALIQSTMLRGAGISAYSFGPFILSQGQVFKIIIDCTGLVMLILFFALLYSTKERRPGRKVQLIASILFLFAFNLFRLFITILSGLFFGENAINLVHPLLWFVDSGVVMLCWIWTAGIRI